MNNNKKQFLRISLLTAFAFMLSACKITPKYTNGNQELNFLVRPKNIQNLKAPSVVTTDNNINVGWQYQDDADGYILYCISANDYTSGENIEEKIIKTLPKDQNSYTITNLESAERYIIGVRAYKTTLGKTVYSEKMELTECATRPTLSIKTDMNNQTQSADLEFETSNRKSILNPGEDIYSPEYIVFSSDLEIFNTYKNSPNNGIIKDENTGDASISARSLKTNTLSSETTLQYAFTTTDSKITTDTLTSNKSVDISVSMSVNKEEISESEQTDKIDNPPNKQPSKVKEVSVVNNLKDRIEITWKASELNNGLENESIVENGALQTVTQVFKVTRTDVADASETVVLDYTDSDNQPLETEDGNLTYTLIDTNVETNKAYVYSVLPYYVFMKNGKKTSSYSGNEETLSEKAFILSTPINTRKEWVVVNNNGNEKSKYKEHKNADAPLEATYTARIYWDMPNSDATNNESVKYTLKVTSTKPDGSVISTLPDGTDMETLNASLQKVQNGQISYYIDCPITLSSEQDKDLWKFSFSLKASNESGDTQGDVNILGDPLESVPSITQIEFIKQSNAEFSPVSENALRTTLKWKIISDEELKQTDSSLSEDNLVFSLSRGETQDNLTDVCFTSLSHSDLVQTGYVLENGYVSYQDTANIKDNKTYYYILTCRYLDETSPYHNRVNNIRFDGVKTLAPVKTISASSSISPEYIEVSFDKPEGAESFKVQYKNASSTGEWTDLNTETDILSTDDVTTGVFHFIKDAHTNEAGCEYDFRVYAKDKNGEVVETPAITETPGSLFGIKGFNVSASANEYADKIHLSWNEVKGTAQYVVYVYEDEECTREIFSETVNGKTEYTMNKSSVETYIFSDGKGYPLSRPYYFKVSPVKNSYKAGVDDKETVSLSSVKGNWLFPPKNIKASKADSRYTILVSWDSVDGADGYEIYRREKGSNNDYEYVSYKPQTSSYFEDLTVSASKEYEYTISTVLGNITSEKQTYSVNETDRIGCLLSIPTKITTSEEGGSLFSISFYPSMGVEGYDIQTTNSLFTITTDQINSAPSSLSAISEGSILTRRNANNEITSVTFYLQRPVIVSNALITVKINSYKTVSNDKRISPIYNAGQKASEIQPSEIVNLVNSTITELIYDANVKANGDWWGNSFGDSVNPAFRDGDKNGDYYIQGETATWYGGCNDDGYLQLRNYYDNNTLLELTTTTNIRLVSQNGGAAGYLGTDPLNYIGGGDTGVVEANLPYDMGTATVKYKSVKADGTGGTYEVTYNGKPTTVTPQEVHKSVRKFI